MAGAPMPEQLARIASLPIPIDPVRTLKNLRDQGLSA
jgi:hypothetical protein